MDKHKKVSITKNGPYLVSGGLPLSKTIAIVGKEGEPEEWQKGMQYPEQESYTLCRCGKSKNKPYCDDTHVNSAFNGTETASKKNYFEQCETIKGPELDLTDSKKLCSTARFCHKSGGTWDNVKNSDDETAKNNAINSSSNCPSGRLIAWDKKTKKPYEKKFDPAIELIEDPQKKVSGPIWLKGGIELESSDGSKYESRNRVTLCRCGKSKNKPFCDGTHIKIGFNDGDESLTK